jgi:hypothetical protein
VSFGENCVKLVNALNFIYISFWVNSKIGGSLEFKYEGINAMWQNWLCKCISAWSQIWNIYMYKFINKKTITVLLNLIKYFFTWNHYINNVLYAYVCEYCKGLYYGGGYDIANCTIHTVYAVREWQWKEK